jgi:hypothetical protein
MSCLKEGAVGAIGEELPGEPSNREGRLDRFHTSQAHTREMKK